MTTPDAFDPTAPLRDLYREAELTILAALTAAVKTTIDDPGGQAMAEARLRRTTRNIVTMLNRAVPAQVETILAAARAEGEARAQE